MERVRYEGDSPLAGRVYRIPQWDRWSYPQKTSFLRAFIEDTSRDPAIATKAMTILRAAGVQVRDARGAWAAILRWVQQNISYQNEPKERFQSPQYTLSTGGPADCFPEDTPVLRDDHTLVRVKHLEPGMRIWGYDRWSTVEAVADKGDLPVTAVRLNNGSTICLTEDHHVYVERCSFHGLCCPTRSQCEKTGKFGEWARIRVSELSPGMFLPTPERVPFGKKSLDPDLAYIEGLYLADGWCSSTNTRTDGSESPVQSFSIAGKDGHPKEEQKREVERICRERGIPTIWHSRYITVQAPAWAQRLHTQGDRAFNKYAETLDLDEASALALLRGLMADSGKNTHGSSRTFTTTSPYLAIQTRLLWKMAGRTCGDRYIVDHGGLGEHPIWRLNPRTRQEDHGAGRREKHLCVKKVTRNVATLRCFDIQTDDHRVYLPAADVTVSQCDDMTIVTAALGNSIRLPWKIVLSGRDGRGEKVRWVEGTPVPAGFDATHIFLQVGGPPFRPRWWTWAEPSLDVPLGWDMMRDQIPANRPDIGAVEQPATTSGRALALVKKVPWPFVAASVIGSVLSFYILRSVKRGR